MSYVDNFYERKANPLAPSKSIEWSWDHDEEVWVLTIRNGLAVIDLRLVPEDARLFGDTLEEQSWYPLRKPKDQGS